eukprot:c3206_g1_i1.p1 GENE.c3206_g1_i1~~c3206_g1_i1.p1  ORF type:complete len:150 (+),score=52.18 c3206_g1_i1:44-493(+)
MLGDDLLDFDVGADDDDDELANKKKKKKLDVKALQAHGYKSPTDTDDKKKGAVICAAAAQVIPQHQREHSPPSARFLTPTTGDPDDIRHARAVLAAVAAEKATKATPLSFKQKEKRKRDLGQSSRGKSYNEEEKRVLREAHSLPSGFDV